MWSWITNLYLNMMCTIRVIFRLRTILLWLLIDNLFFLHCLHENIIINLFLCTEIVEHNQLQGRMTSQRYMSKWSQQKELYFLQQQYWVHQSSMSEGVNVKGHIAAIKMIQCLPVKTNNQKVLKLQHWLSTCLQYNTIPDWAMKSNLIQMSIFASDIAVNTLCVEWGGNSRKRKGWSCEQFCGNFSDRQWIHFNALYQFVGKQCNHNHQQLACVTLMSTSFCLYTCQFCRVKEKPQKR